MEGEKAGERDGEGEMMKMTEDMMKMTGESARLAG